MDNEGKYNDSDTKNEESVKSEISTAGKADAAKENDGLAELLAAKKAEARDNVNAQIKKQRLISSAIFGAGAVALIAGTALTAVTGEALPGAPVLAVGAFIAVSSAVMHRTSMKRLRHILAQIEEAK